MSLVLLSAAALLGRSLRNLEHQNFGFETEGRYIAWINPMLGNYKPEQMEPMFRKIDDRLRQIPGVRMVAPALYAPMTGDSWNEGIRIAGQARAGGQRRHECGVGARDAGLLRNSGCEDGARAGRSPTRTPRRRAR